MTISLLTFALRSFALIMFPQKTFSLKTFAPMTLALSTFVIMASVLSRLANIDFCLHDVLKQPFTHYLFQATFALITFSPVTFPDIICS
jgi:hypothetical protein